MQFTETRILKHRIFLKFYFINDLSWKKQIDWSRTKDMEVVTR